MLQSSKQVNISCSQLAMEGTINFLVAFFSLISRCFIFHLRVLPPSHACRWLPVSALVPPLFPPSLTHSPCGGDPVG